MLYVRSVSIGEFIVIVAIGEVQVGCITVTSATAGIGETISCTVFEINLHEAEVISQ
ncbi:hypothetical protein D3C87_538930 [compost metagenome]